MRAAVVEKFCDTACIKRQILRPCCDKVGRKRGDWMIEIIYKEEKQEAKGNESFFHLPNNIRQIGDCHGNHKIYMEDYVYTHLKKVSSGLPPKGEASVLLGYYKWADGISYIFIQGAVTIQDFEVDAQHIPFSDAVWGAVHGQMEKYFPSLDIVGWCLSLPGFDMQINDVILRAHLNHFAGSDKVLFLMEPNEKEESFFVYDSGKLKKETGFYVYYEKNTPMQEYMIAENKNQSVENETLVRDKAVVDFRKIIADKQEKKTEGLPRPFVYGAAACAAAAILAVGAAKFGAYDAVNNMLSDFGNGDSQEAVDAGAENVTGEREEAEDTERVTEGNQDAEKEEPEETQGAAQNQKAEAEEEANENTLAQSSATSDTASPTPSPQPSPEEKSDSDPQESSAQTSGAQLRKSYTISQGDTLSEISKRYYGNMDMVDAICELNGISPNDIIYEGQIILLP